MRTPLLALACLGAIAAAEPITIDWDKARTLHQRVSRGETLSPEDQKYYEEAKRQHNAGRAPASQPAAQESSADIQRAKEIHRRKEAGEKVSEEEDRFLSEMMRRHMGGGNPPQHQGERPSAPPAAAPQGLTPLSDLSGRYRDQECGLYGPGINVPPSALAARAETAAKAIRPLDSAGKPAADGKIALLSIGMSNTTMEFSAFKRMADTDPRKAAAVVLVDGAQGGRTAQSWATDDRVWQEADRRIAAAGASPAQVQAVWLKQANAGPTEGWPAATDKLRDNLQKDIDLARQHYPNLRLVFLSSRIYAGYATSRLNPEPYAYESAFAVRQVIQKQASDGPVVLWGPYLWADGEKGRKGDDLKWTPADFGADGTHPSPAGQQKVAGLLLDFFTTAPYAQPWFVKR